MAKGPTRKYVVLSPVKHDGVDYQPGGKPIELTEAEAEALLVVKAIEAAADKKPEPEKA